MRTRRIGTFGLAGLAAVFLSATAMAQPAPAFRGNQGGMQGGMMQQGEGGPGGGQGSGMQGQGGFQGQNAFQGQGGPMGRGFAGGPGMERHWMEHHWMGHPMMREHWMHHREASSAAFFRFRRRGAEIDVRCSARESMQACVAAASALMDKVASMPQPPESGGGTSTTPGQSPSSGGTKSGG